MSQDSVLQNIVVSDFYHLKVNFNLAFKLRHDKKTAILLTVTTPFDLEKDFPYGFKQKKNVFLGYTH